MSTTDALPPESGPLSVDQAVELLAGPDAVRDDDDAPEAAAPTPDDGGQPDMDGGPQAPHFWAAEDKAAFAELPPHLQQKVAAYEKNRDAAASRVIQEAAEARNHAHARAAEAGDLSARLSALVPQAEAAFAGRWGGREPDWNHVAQVHGPDQALQLKAAFDQDREAMGRLHAAAQEADARNFSHYVANEYEKLKGVEPDLVDAKRGGARRQAVVNFLAHNGVPPEQIRHVGAVELALAYDALRYRLATSALAKPQRASGSRPSLSPAAAQGARSQQQRSAASSKARFAQKPTIDNAVAAILAKR